MRRKMEFRETAAMSVLGVGLPWESVYRFKDMLRTDAKVRGAGGVVKAEDMLFYHKYILSIVTF